jgi:hypothetical protein
MTGDDALYAPKFEAKVLAGGERSREHSRRKAEAGEASP